MGEYTEFMARECNTKELLAIIRLNEARYERTESPEERRTLAIRLKELNDALWSRRAR